MKVNDDRVPRPIRQLLQLLADSEEGFRKLSTGLRSDEAVLMCLEESVVRARYHGELREAAGRIWRELPEGQTIVGRLHRGWLDLQITLGLSDSKLLSTAQSCEAATLAGYEAALAQGDLPASVRSMLAHQRRHVEAVHTHLQSLERRLVNYS